ncbi:MAG: hypothetical protein WCG27_09510, partial [Pseudomonadota bacterium]
LGASVFILAMGLVLLSIENLGEVSKKTVSISWKIALLSGILFGLSFHLRYQLGFAIFLFYLWCLLIGRFSLKTGMIMTSALILSILSFIPVDSWGYGEWTLPVLNYFKVNFPGPDPKIFGSSPWYGYLRVALNRGFPPISLLIIIGTAIFYWKNWKHPFTWVTLPFLLLHSCLAHKELRFVFLVVLLAPLMATLGFQSLKNNWNPISWKTKAWGRYFFYFIIGCNFLLLLYVTLTPAKMTPVFYKHVLDKRPAITQLYHRGENPFTLIGLPVRFYWPYSLKIDQFNNWEELNFLLQSRPKPVWAITVNQEDYLKIVKDFPQCRMDFSSYPAWLMSRIKWQKTRVWALFECR